MFQEYTPKTQLEKIILRYPDKPYNKKYLASNPNISSDLADILKLDESSNLDHETNRFLDFNKSMLWDCFYMCRYKPYKSIIKNSLVANKQPYLKKWDFFLISSSPETTLEFIENNLDYIDWSGLSMNPNISKEFIDKHINLDWNWQLLSRNPKITLDLIKKHRNKPWYFKNLANNLNFNIEWLLYLYNNYSVDDKYFWQFCSRHRSIMCEDVEKYSSLPWDWAYISENPNIDIVFIKKHLDKPWDYESLSSHKNITMKNIQDNPNIPWNYNGISINPNITRKYILSNLEKIKFRELSINRSLDLNLVIDLPDYPWDYLYLSCHRNLNIDIVLKSYQTGNTKWDWENIAWNPRIDPMEFIKHPELPVKIRDVLSNSNLTIEYIDRVYQKMDANDWLILSCNPFKYDSDNSGQNYGYNDNRFRKTRYLLEKFKEELMIKTWHPSRVVEWCLDIDELEDSDKIY